MPKDNLRLPRAASRKSAPYRSVILQGEFDSTAARQEFIQTITAHGLTFLRLAGSPLPKMSSPDFGVAKRLMASINKFRAWRCGKGVHL